MTSTFQKTAHRGLYFRESDRAYQLIVTVGYQQHKRVIYNHSEATALDKLRDWREELEGKKSGITMQKLFNEHIALVGPIQSLQTIRTKEGYWAKWIAPRYAQTDINRLTYKDYQTFVNELLNVGLKPKTVKHIIGLCQTLYNYALRLGYTDKNPVSAVELPRFDNTRYFSLKPEQSKAFIKTVFEFEDPFYRAFWLFLLHGRRLNEVKSITWKDINLETGIYEIPAPINKARRNMSYTATPALLGALLEIRPMSVSPEKLVFPSPVTGGKLQDVRRSWEKLRKAWAKSLGVDFASLPYMRIHDIRHMIGDVAINQLHKPIEKVAHTLGHTSVGITERYVNRRAGSSADVIGDLIEGSLND